jgi:hypothetical protein
MNTQRALLTAYRFLLLLYPATFRNRFAPEMLDLAAAAEPSEWPLILGDTSFAIMRCWFNPEAPSSAAVPAAGTYLAIGESSLRPLRLFQGFVLSVLIVFGLWYIDSQFPAPPPCREISTELVSPPPTIRNAKPSQPKTHANMP